VSPRLRSPGRTNQKYANSTHQLTGRSKAIQRRRIPRATHNDTFYKGVWSSPNGLLTREPHDSRGLWQNEIAITSGISDSFIKRKINITIRKKKLYLTVIN